MKTKMTLLLFSSLILTTGYFPNIYAVTDAELEALEKQIEQQETEKKKQIEAEVKRKAEAIRKAEGEAKRKAEAKAEKNRIAELEKQRLEEAKQVSEEKRKAEEAQRQEEEKKEKYNLIIAVAEQAINDKDKELAISKYNNALVLYPNNELALIGLKKAEGLTDNGCSDIIGVWRWNDLTRTTTRFYEDGKVISKNIFKSEGTWECIDPKNRIFTANTWGKKRKIKMSDDANQLESTNAFTGLKLIGIKISDNPFEKIGPAQSSSSNIPGL